MTRLLTLSGSLLYSSYHQLDNDVFNAPMAYQPRPVYIRPRIYPYWDMHFLMWSSGRLQGGNAPLQTIISSSDYDPALRYIYPALHHSGMRYYKFTGVTRDSSGAVLGNAIVQLIHTSDDALIQQTTSDASGNYELYSPYSDGHYIVGYKAGSPDVAGTTVNTLTGTL